MEKEFINFIGAGTMKAGTSWVFKCLSEHPKVNAPTISTDIVNTRADRNYKKENKEIHFFDRWYHLGRVYYEKRFEYSREKINGEFTPGYFYSTEALYRLKKNYPSVKIILGFRNPIERTISHLNYAISNNRKVHLKDLNIQSPFIDRSIYSGRYFSLKNIFSDNEVFIYFYDELLQDPEGLLSRMFDFLEVDSSFRPPSIKERVNKPKLPQEKGILKFLGRKKSLNENEVKDYLLGRFGEVFREDIEWFQSLTEKEVPWDMGKAWILSS